jgi:antitoxin component YwqK of YwqJK toxin-antitoxin module
MTAQRSLLSLCFILCLNSFYAQELKQEHLTDRERLYWDAGNKKIRARGAYYQDEIVGVTTEKHGKWWFYDAKGSLTEEQYFYRGRIHGKQLSYHLNKRIASESHFVFNVADSVFREWNEDGKLIVEGLYEMGSPNGEWKYFYEDGALKSRKQISNDTVYMIDHYTGDSLHSQVVKAGEGEIKSFYVSGGLKEYYTYSKGLKTGPFEERLANGIISILGGFNRGLKDGKWTFYFPNGRIEKCVNYKKDKLNGSYLVMNSDSTINTVGNYQAGKKDGDWIWYNENKTLEMKGSFSGGLQDGEWKYYFSSGELSYNAGFNRGSRSGQWTYFFKDGTLFKEGKYLKNMKDGLWRTNYESGNLLMTGLYSKGKEQGVWLNYWENGTKKNKAEFKNGILNGVWASYSPNENLLLTGKYKNGLKSGEWKTFDDKSKLLLLENFKVIKSQDRKNEIVIIGRNQEVSVLHGSFESYSETDYAIKASGSYKKGKKNGTFIDYYPGGVVPTIVAQYKDGDLHGLFQQFSRRGNIRHQIEYKNNLKDGAFIIFNDSGKVVVRKNFYKGRELRN